MTDLQERQKHDNFFTLKPLKVFGDIVQETTDSKVVKTLIKGKNYIVDGVDIVRSDYPGDAAYSWVIGAETSAVTADTIFVMGKILNIRANVLIIPTVIASAEAGDYMQNNIKEKLQKFREKQETADKQEDKDGNY